MRRNPSIFFWTVRLKPHDRNRLHARATHPEPQRVRRARGRSGGQRYRSTKRSKRKNSGTDRAKGGDGGNTIAHLEEELAD